MGSAILGIAPMNSFDTTRRFIDYYNPTGMRLNFAFVSLYLAVNACARRGWGVKGRGEQCLPCVYRHAPGAEHMVFFVFGAV